MIPNQDSLSHPGSLDQGAVQLAETKLPFDASSVDSGKYDLSVFGVNALRYFTGYRECPDCDFTTRLDRFDPRLLLVHGDYAHLRLTIKEMRQQIATPSI